MTGKEEVETELHGWEWLHRVAKVRAYSLARALKGRSDRSGIAGLLMQMQDDAVSARDKEIPLVLDVVRGILEVFAAERRQAGQAEKTGTEAFYIRRAVAEITEDRPFDADEGEWLPESVANRLEDNPPDKFPNLCDEDKEIRRVLRRMNYKVPPPART